MSDNEKVVSPPAIVVHDVHVRPLSIARFTLGYWSDRAAQECMFQLTNPIGQHLAFYVHPDEKARVIAEFRVLLAAWEKSP